MTPRFDHAVVGAGIVGLAHAYLLARRGEKVIVFERGDRAQGASVRNFGMLWPIGQPPGPLHALATRSLETWHEVLDRSGLWRDRCGSLHLAHREDEFRVLGEFAASSGLDCEILDRRGVERRSPLVRPDRLIGGLFSAAETCVDPRQVIAELPRWLAETQGVRFEFATAVTRYERPRVVAGGRTFEADRLWVCAGDDLRTLYPAELGAMNLARCKLQMMRTAPLGGGSRLGPMLAGGLTLRHYKSFEACPSLPALKARIARETPEFDRFGIHVMASQNALGEVVIGDSHEYGDAIEPFDKPEIDRLVLEYLHGLIELPDLEIASRWHGTYAKSPTSAYEVARPEPGVVAVAGLGGAGMTLSFGLAEKLVAEECIHA